MDIAWMNDFVTLAACRSFSRAAALRHVTQPAFSRRIRALETAAGAALVDRSDKSFRPTAAGERFLTHARHILVLTEQAQAEVQSLSTRMNDPVYIVAPSYLSKTFFPQWYKAMQKAVPGLNIRISGLRGSGALADLRRGAADFALVMTSRKLQPCYDLSGLETQVIGHDRMVAVASPRADKGAFVMYEQGSYMNNLAETLFGRRLSAGRVVFESSSTGLLKEMALAGFGMAALPQSVASDDLAAGYLMSVSGIKGISCDIMLVLKGAGGGKRQEKLWRAAQGT
jgi:DNA-binding transcriptional LysR family regulator